ncbi:transposase [Flavobacterium branchiophilum]|uniref:Uncharacterized protein n=2 Tax=Flavobacterium branchiophilum TaxID=55197 RepID=G2Z0Q7_FLABF|nr:transposase [Flavobacterium branchiophilum]PDS27033.1 transposase [Flavobacterium branchiophilum]CCB71010.1 Hypothetical protein FBFL15_3066 [Flavobacterium branchiophilum FL-15]
MKKNTKNIHIGSILEQSVEEQNISLERIAKYFKCSIDDVEKMFLDKSLDSEQLLKWCKLLKYDFFRYYTGHLILYHGISTSVRKQADKNMQGFFKKNVYTVQIKNYILDGINKNKFTINEVMDKYNIPRTTIYNWLRKETVIDYKLNN